MPQELQIEINPEGEAKVTVRGVKGKSCKAVSKAIEEALGQVTEDQPTAEMREVGSNADQHQRQR